MHKIYTSRYINTISLIITVILFLISNTIYYIIQNPKILQIGIKNTVKVEFDDKTNISQNTTKENENNKNKEKTNSTNQTKEEKQAKTENATTKETNIKEKQWYLKIPRIFSSTQQRVSSKLFSKPKVIKKRRQNRIQIPKFQKRI